MTVTDIVLFITIALIVFCGKCLSSKLSLKNKLSPTVYNLIFALLISLMISFVYYLTNCSVRNSRKTKITYDENNY